MPQRNTLGKIGENTPDRMVEVDFTLRRRNGCAEGGQRFGDGAGGEYRFRGDVDAGISITDTESSPIDDFVILKDPDGKPRYLLAGHCAVDAGFQARTDERPRR